MNNKIKYYFSPVSKRKRQYWYSVLNHQLYIQNTFVPVYIELLDIEVEICLQ